jgi:hypothetical protein
MKEKTTTEIPVEARTAIALAFEGMGGLKKLIAWAKSHQSIFYTQLYSKLAPMQLQGQLSVEADNTAAAAIEHILLALIAARREDEQRGVVIDVEPNREAAPIGEPEGVVIDAEPSASSVGNVVRLNVTKAAEVLAVGQPAQPSTTEKYLEWSGSSRPWWGPVGS